MPQDKLLTLSEVAEVLGLDEKQVKELVDTGCIPYYKTEGKSVGFKESAVERIKAELLARVNLGSDYLEEETGLPAEEGIGEEPSQDTSPLDSQSESLADKVMDFWYFYDFYIISIMATVVIVYIIFKTVK